MFLISGAFDPWPHYMYTGLHWNMKKQKVFGRRYVP